MLLLTFVFLYISLSSEASALGCTRVGSEHSLNYTACVQYGYIEVEGHRVRLGAHNLRIQLEEPMKLVSVICEHLSFVIPFGNDKQANQVRVSFLRGYVHMDAYWCKNFDGPTRGGIKCVIEAFSRACPGRVNHTHTCVYEVETAHFSSTTVRKAKEVKTEIAADVRKLRGSISVSHAEERVDVRTYSYKSRSYIVIPAGYRFCTFSIVESKKSHSSTTGFKWQCKAPSFVQTRQLTGRCSDLPLCEAQSPCPISDNNKPPNCGEKSAILQPFGMLLVVFTMHLKGYLTNWYMVINHGIITLIWFIISYNMRLFDLLN